MAVAQKIVHLIGALDQFDASHNLRELAGNQAATGSATTVITFSAARVSCQEVESMGVHVDIVHKRWGFDPFAARQLTQRLAELQPEIVHFWGRRAVDSAPIVHRAAPQAKLVATLVKIPQLANPWWPNKSLDALEAIVVERAATRARFIDAGQGEGKIHVIPPGVQTELPAPAPRLELLTRLGLPTEARIIALAGALERWQLVDEAIWAFELIRILHDHTHLVIVGDGPERPRLERFTRQVTEPAVVRFIPHTELIHDVLAHCEIYWQPGTSESIPPALLMAMSAGRPVVASDIPAHRVVVTSETNGFLVPTAKRAHLGPAHRPVTPQRGTARPNLRRPRDKPSPTSIPSPP